VGERERLEGAREGREEKERRHLLSHSHRVCVYSSSGAVVAGVCS